MTDEAMSPLRRRMIEDMTIRKFAPKTQHDYVQRVKNFAAFLGRSPDTASFEDVRRYQLADSDESGHRFRSKADSVPIDCGQHSDDPGQGARVDGRQGVTEGDGRQALTVLAAVLRMLSPFNVSLWALCTSRSRMASATVGFAIASCQ
jgi:hypothetical protein